MTQLISILMTGLLIAGAPPVLTFAGEAPKTLNYVAIGDSVAAGVRGGIYPPGSEPGSDKGYTDYIANKLKSAGVLGDFNKDICVAGATALELAQRVGADLSGPAGKEATAIKNADIITFDAGANDLLGPLYQYLMPLLADPGSEWYTDNRAVIGHVSDIVQQLMGDLNSDAGLEVETNIEAILGDILAANPDARIYVMGYYNPLPAAKLYGLDLDAPTASFNSLIKRAISAAAASGGSITFVETMKAMGENPESLSADPMDIHPTEAGYVIIGDIFWKIIAKDFDLPTDESAKAEKVKAESVKINMPAVTVKKGRTLQLSAAVAPPDADQAVTWSSSNAGVAAIDENGLVTALKTGTARITATTADGKAAVTLICVTA